MKIPITLIPQGRVAQDPNLGFRVRRLSPVPAPAVAERSGGEEFPIPAGSDRWYDAPTASVIPFRAYAGAKSAATDATDFGTDDAVAAESDLPAIVSPLASAWWQLTVPDDVSDARLTVDTWLTANGRLNGAGTDPATYAGDTNLTIWTTDEALPLGTLPTGSTDFNTLVNVANIDDSPDPRDPDRIYTSMVPFLALDAGKVYWIRVDTWGGGESPGTMYHDGIVYQLQVSLTFTPP